MADRLKNVLTFTAAAPGVATPQAHGLNASGLGLVPDRIIALASGFSITADTTNVTVTNLTGAAANLQLYVEAWHTIERTFGDVGVTALNPQPIIEVAAPSGVSGDAVRFTDSGTLDIYVDGASGSDSNDGLTAGTALATIGAVYTKFPWYVLGAARITVHLADNGVGGTQTYTVEKLIMGGGPADQATAWGDVVVTYQYLGPEMVAYAPATGPSTAALDVGAGRSDIVNDAGAVAGAGNLTRLNFTAAAPGWTPDDLVQGYVRIKRGGVKVVREWPIRSNTGNTITLAGPDVDGLVQDGDTVEIVQPGVYIDSDDPTNKPIVVSGIVAAGGDEWNQQIGNGFTRIAFGWVDFYNCYAAYDRCSFMGGYAEWMDGLVGAFFNCLAFNTSLILNTSSSIWATPIDDAPGDPINNDSCSLSLYGGALQCGGTKPVTVNFLKVVSCHEGYGASVQNYSNATFIQGLIGLMTASAFGYGLAIFFRASAKVKGPTAPAGGTGKTTIDGNTIGIADIRLGQYGTLAVAWGNAVGAFEEVAGWNGNLQNYPAVIGAQGDGALLRGI